MSDQDCFGILDSEFDHYLVDMKPYVLKLIDKTGENTHIQRENALSFQHRICKATNKKILLENDIFCPSDRQRCALWIKKLCDPETCGSGLTGRKNRNMYARLLLHMLRKGVLEGPFTHKPEAGGLKTLPTYMVNTALIHAFTLICIRQHNTIKSLIGLRPGISGDC